MSLLLFVTSLNGDLRVVEIENKTEIEFSKSKVSNESRIKIKCVCSCRWAAEIRKS